MGSGPWTHWVQWEEDVEAALQKARQRVFDTGEYVGADRAVTSLGLEAVVDELSEVGTGSVLDARRTVPRPAVGCATALTPAEVNAFFGAVNPTREQVEKGLPTLWEDLQRGEAAWMTAYVNGQPTEFCFTGFSADTPAWEMMKELLSGGDDEVAGGPPLAGDEGRAPLSAGLLDMFTKLHPTPELAAIIGDAPIRQNDAVKKLWEYVRANGLQDGVNIRADEKLRRLFGKDSVTMFEMTKALKASLKKR